MSTKSQSREAEEAVAPPAAEPVLTKAQRGLPHVPPGQTGTAGRSFLLLFSTAGWTFVCFVF